MFLPWNRNEEQSIERLHSDRGYAVKANLIYLIKSLHFL